MSYESTSVLPTATNLATIRDLLALLGYKPVSGGHQVPDLVGSCFWFDRVDYRSFTGVEADVYRESAGQITVTTRSNASRSHWDLIQQNKTLKLIRDLAGGQFTTDAGRNRYWRPDGRPMTPRESGCYLARWRFHNALMRAHVYTSNRRFDGPIAKDGPSGLFFMDDVNPRLLSNNMLLPYAIAVWEDYFRSTFAALLSYSGRRRNAIKKAALTANVLEQVADGHLTVDEAVAESLAFQHPAAIVDQFKLIDSKADFGAAFRKPYNRRKVALFDSIAQLVEGRNEFVHTGRMNHLLFDAALKRALADLEVAVDRVFKELARCYDFQTKDDHVW